MPKSVVILGAGAIGCAVGAMWGDRLGPSVRLIGRPAVVASLQDAAVNLTGRVALSVRVAASSEVDALAGADAVVLALKAHGLAAAMDQIRAHVPPGVTVISLLNGLDPVRRLRADLPDHSVIAGMVPFNVVWTGPNTLHVTGLGDVALERHMVTTWLRDAGCAVDLYDDLGPVQHGKLLLNLVNAVNALSGVSLHAMLSDRGYRRVYAAAIEEALACYKAAGTDWAQVGPTNPKVAIPMLRAPDWVFRRVVLNRQNLDPASLTSTAHDVRAGRRTEIDTINGEVVRLGTVHGVSVPVNTALVRLVSAFDDGAAMSAKDLMREVGL